MIEQTENVVSNAEALLSMASNPARPSQANAIEQYWDARARTYSNGVKNEFADERLSAWKDIFSSCMAVVSPHAAETVASTTLNPTPVTALDLGCGPGFFTAILSGLGAHVTAVDSSTNMLARARENVAEHGKSSLVTYLHSDVTSLDLPDASVDLIVSRNVTWLMEDPKAAYVEWRRVLRSGGRLLVFDANWYSYLVDAHIDQARRSDQADITTLGWDEDARSTEDQDRRCEQIALQLPLTYETRPGWDVQTLTMLGFDRITIDNGVWRRVWSPGEQEFYASSPLFMIEAIK